MDSLDDDELLELALGSEVPDTVQAVQLVQTGNISLLQHSSQVSETNTNEAVSLGE